MPPKVVYGKKKTATRTETSFTKFISPEKGGTTAAQNGGAAQHGGKMGEDCRQQLETAATKTTDMSAMDALEKGLEGMRLEQTQTSQVKKAKKTRIRKAIPEVEILETKENQDPREDMSRNKEEDVASEKQTQKRQGRAAVRTPKAERPKRPEDRNADPTVEVQVNTLEPRSTRGKARQPAGDSHSSPTRVRQLVSRPKHSTPKRQPSPPTPPQPSNVYSKCASPLLAMSDTKMIQPFDEWSTELESHFEITKIAEASFSEVYRLSTPNPSEGSNQESVLKLVALKTPPDVPLACQSNTRTVRDREGQVEKERAERDEKDQWKSYVDDVVSEVKLLQNLNHIPGFTDFRELTILQGRPTPFFATAWKAWNKSRARGKKSEFPDPSKKTSYEETQLWAVVEMQDAGTDCEKLMEAGGLTSIWEVWDVFWGVCLSVAKAEETCKFEHRDLHLGNICVRSSKPDGDVMVPSIEDPAHRKFRFTGLETTVIDYTLSRANILASPSRRSSSSSVGTLTSSSSALEPTSSDVAFFDLDKDPAVFTGDAGEEYQYEIYRYMRGAVLYDNPLQNSAPEPPVPVTRSSPRKNTHIRFNSTQSVLAANPWRAFHPKTNLVWAHFLLHKLLAHVQTSDKASLANVADKEVDAAKVKKKAAKLHAVLKKVADSLCPVALGKEEGLGSVKDLVLVAVEQRWLRVGDVSG